MTSEMVKRARENVAANEAPDDAANVSFPLGEIEHQPVGDGAIDVVISNRVVNLLPDKPQVLRSVVVTAPYRGQGYGAALCAALEAEARARGVETLYLLTTTATEFFRRQGYAVVDRETAPASIQEAAPFRDLCPATADRLRERLR